MTRVPIEVIKHDAQARVTDIVRALGIRDRPRGGYISCCNPTRKDRHPSFTIWISGAAAGAWKDHRFEATDCGDIIDLVAYLQGWFDEPSRGRRKSIAWLADFLGHGRLSEAERRVLQGKARRDRHEAALQAAAIDADKRKQAFRLWLDAKPIEDSPVITYLAARGIELDALARMPRILRYLPDHLHRESGRRLPCMVAGMVDARGRIGAIHRTFLAPDGRGKADVTPTKKIWPAFAGLFIPLARGGSGLPVREAIEHGLLETLALTEGIEEGLTLAMADPELRIWAAGSLGNMPHVPLPACIDSLLICRANEGSADAVEAYARAKAQLGRHGLPIAEIESHVGKDLNDILRGEQ